MTLTEGSFCTGYNGLGLAAESVLGTELAWVSEVDPSACAVLDAHYPGVDNLGDLTVIDWSKVEPVDVLTSGYPCQPFSTAGRRQGANDERHLWPFIADAIGVLRPGVVVLENVAGHLSLGFDVVLADLARLGYDTTWRLVRASDVGACHRRARLFVVAHARGERVRPRRRGGLPGAAGTAEGDGTERQRLRAGVVDGGQDAADSERSGRAGRSRAEGREGRRTAADGTGEDAPADAPGDTRRVSDRDGGSVGHTTSHHQWHEGIACGSGQGGASQPARSAGSDAAAWGAYGPAIARHAGVLGRPAPDPVDGRGRLNPVFVEWMMMLPAGWVTDIVTNRSKALKCLGNGVVPPQAAHALRSLLALAVVA